MAADYYSDTPTAPPTPDVQPTDANPDKGKGGDSALLPKSIIGEVEPGQTITLKVVHVYEDEIEVEKVGTETEEPQETEGTEDEAESEIDRLAMTQPES